MPGGLSVSANGGATWTNYTAANGLINTAINDVYASGSLWRWNDLDWHQSGHHCSAGGKRLRRERRWEHFLCAVGCANAPANGFYNPLHKQRDQLDRQNDSRWPWKQLGERRLCQRQLGLRSDRLRIERLDQRGCELDELHNGKRAWIQLRKRCLRRWQRDLCRDVPRRCRCLYNRRYELGQLHNSRWACVQRRQWCVCRQWLHLRCDTERLEHRRCPRALDLLPGPRGSGLRRLLDVAATDPDLTRFGQRDSNARGAGSIPGLLPLVFSRRPPPAHQHRAPTDSRVRVADRDLQSLTLVSETHAPRRHSTRALKTASAASL